MTETEQKVAALDTFTRQYIITMLWIENDPDTEEPLDKDHDMYDLAPCALDKVIADCASFQAAHGELFEGNESDAGHDFWLTRKGHGCGYWDGDWPEHGDALTEACKAYPEQYVYVGYDGLIYID